VLAVLVVLLWPLTRVTLNHTQCPARAGVDRGVQVGPVPGLPEPGQQGAAEVVQPHGAVGVVGRGGRDHLLEQVDSCIQRGSVTGT
jgi:hypothetical protein